MYLVVNGPLPATAAYAPLVLLPFLLFCLGVAWVLSAAGVFLRDMSQITQVLTTVLMFLSPLFYPLSAIPEPLRKLVLLNPLAYPIEEFRAVMLFGLAPNWPALGVYTLFAACTMWAGFACFKASAAPLPMSSEPLEPSIRVAGVSKAYRSYGRATDRARQLIVDQTAFASRLLGFEYHNLRYYREFWALQDVTFNVMRASASVFSDAMARERARCLRSLPARCRRRQARCAR